MDFVASLHDRATRCRARVLFPESSDERVREAVREMKARGVAEPVLVGHSRDAMEGIELIDVANPAITDAVAAQLLLARSHKGLSAAEASELSKLPLFVANSLVSAGQADGCVAGAVHTTADVIRAALWLVGTRKRLGTLSSAFYMDVPPFRDESREVLTFTDCGVIRKPTAEQLVDIALSAAADRVSIVGDEPRIAFLSYSTRGSAEGESVDRIRLAVKKLRAVAPELAVDGELQGDAALIGAVAARKAPGSAVAGTANILVFPDLDSGNIAYKLVQRLASAHAIGPILQGLRFPCNDLSRGASAADIFNVAALTALQASNSAATRTNGFRQETT